MIHRSEKGAGSRWGKSVAEAISGRIGIPLLGITLALTVFTSSLVLETRHGAATPASIGHRSRFSALTAGPLVGGTTGKTGELLCSETPVSEPGRDVATLLERGREALQSGNVESAEALAGAALKTTPDSPLALSFSGEVAFRQARYEDAERILRKLFMDHAGVSVESRVQLGVAQLRLGRHGPALETLRLCVRDRRSDPALHFFLACAYAGCAETERALTHLERACGPLGFPLLPFAGDPCLAGLRGNPRFRRLLHAALDEGPRPAFRR